MANNDSPFDVDGPTDETIEIPDDGVLVPKGTYAAQVISVRSDISRSSGNPTLIWDFQLLEGEARGEQITMWTSRVPKAIWKLASVLRALGFQATNNKFVFQPAQAIGRRAMVEIVVEPYEGQMQSKVKAVHPHPGGPDPGAPAAGPK